MTHAQIANALVSLRPGAQWAFAGDTLDALTWLDESQSRPTDAEITAEAERLAALPPRRPVPKSLIIQRLHEAGHLDVASAALNANLYARERWYAPDQPAVYADDVEVTGLLTAIGADVDAILAPA
jgi:hypothetical protein